MWFTKAHKARKGYQLLEQLLRKLLSQKLSRKKGIETIAGPEQKTVIDIQTKQLFNDMSDSGFDMNKITERDAMYFLNMKKQKMDELVKSGFGELNLDKGIKSLEKSKKGDFLGFDPKIVKENTTLDDLMGGKPYIDERGRKWQFDKPKKPEIIKIDPSEQKQSMFNRQQKEIEGIDTEKAGMKFYSDMSDAMKRHKLEELEFDYDIMFNKLVEKAKQIDADPKVLLEAELGTKLTGKETTTQLLDLFKNRVKRAGGGIAPLIGEPSYAADFYDDRIPYEGGGRAGFPPITAKPQSGNLPMQGPKIPAPSVQPAGITGSEMILKQQKLDQQKMQMNPMMNQGIGGMQKYGGQFRKPFEKGGKGGFDPSKRKFLKASGAGLALLSSLPFVGKFFKAATPVAKAVGNVASSNAVGMPAWFPKLIEKVLKQGEDVTDAYATQERVMVKKIKLPKSQTEVLVEQDLVTGDTLVNIGMGKHGWSAGRHGQPSRLVLKKGEQITEGKQAGKKTPDEFTVEEAEFTGGHPENVKFEEIAEAKYGDHASDFSEVEEFAIGKNVDKKIIGKKAQSDAWAEGRAESRAEEFDPDVEFASGGLARLLGE